MANFTSVYLFAALAKGEIDLSTDALGMLLFDATCDVTEINQFLSDVTTLGEVTGTGYVRVLLTAAALVTDEPNKKVYLTADPVEWASVDLGSAVAGALLYKEGAGDSVRLILGKIDETGFPFSAAGGVPIVIRPSATDGFLLIKKGV
jgi:hypothetical protein